MKTKLILAGLLLFIGNVFAQEFPAPRGMETSHILAIQKTTTELNALGYGVNDRVLAYDSTLDEWVRWNGTAWVSAFSGSSFDESADYTPSGFWNFTGNMQSTGNVDFLGTFEWHNNSFRATMPNLTQNDTIATQSYVQDYTASLSAPLFTSGGINELASLPNYASAVGLGDGLLFEAGGTKHYLAVGNLPYYRAGNFVAGVDYVAPSSNQNISGEITFLSTVIVSDGTASNHAVNKGQLDTAIAGVSGGGNPNQTSVSTLAQLQNVSDGTSSVINTVLITDSIDLGNTDITLTNVYIADGGAEIVSTGTGELTLLGDSTIANSLLNYQLKINSNSTGKLSSSVFDFIPTKWGIDQNITNPIATNLTGLAIARLNRDRIKKALADSHLLGMKTFVLNGIDFYIDTAFVGNPISQNGTDTSAYSIIPPSGTHFLMSHDTHIRQYPNAYTSLTVIAVLNTSNVTIEGGNIHGDRLGHMYNQYARIVTAPTSSPIKVTIGETGAATEYDIPVSAFDETTVLNEMAAWITTNVSGVTATVENFADVGGSGDILVMTTGIPGYRENLFISENDTSGIAWNGYLFDHSLAHGIYVVGSTNTTIKDVNLLYQTGDGIAAVPDGQIHSGGDNNINLNIIGCYLQGQRRIGIALNSSEIAIVENNRIYEVGLEVDLGSGRANTGTSPAAAIWFEPFGSSDADGNITYNSFSNRTIVRNNYVYDCRDTGIGAFASVNLTIENNETNNTIALGTSQGCIIIKNKIDLTKGNNPHLTAFTINMTANDKNAGVVWERAKNIVISNNEITGRGVSTEVGAVLKGWKLNMHNNLFRNIGGVQLQMNSHLIDSKIHDNTYETDPSITTSTWFDDAGVGKMENVQFYNENVTVYGTTHDLGINATGTISTGYEVDGLDVSFTNCKFKSISNAAHIIRNSKYLTFDNCEWNSEVTITGANNQYLTFTNCRFPDAFRVHGTSTAINDSSWINCDFTSVSATAAFSFESRGASSGNVIANNRLNQTSGNEAMRLWVTGGTHSDYKIFNNVLVNDGATEFIDATIDDSSIWNNIDVNTGAISQTITLGTGGVANRVN